MLLIFKIKHDGVYYIMNTLFLTGLSENLNFIEMSWTDSFLTFAINLDIKKYLLCWRKKIQMFANYVHDISTQSGYWSIVL